MMQNIRISTMTVTRPYITILQSNFHCIACGSDFTCWLQLRYVDFICNNVCLNMQKVLQSISVLVNGAVD